MVNVSVDPSKCIGCHLCVSSCPECFKMGEDNIAKAAGGECKTCDLEEVAARCPVEAITVKK